MSRFTETLWARALPTYEAICDHPFLRELATGSLDRAAFRYYVVQDSHYLRDYARALALCSARAAEPDTIAMFAQHAHDAIVVERSLHAGLLTELGISDEAPGVAPTTLAYTSYLLATCATGSFAESVGAVLPCYWIYREVGQRLIARGSPDPLYSRWIETYGGPEFAAVVQAVLDVTDALAESLSPNEKEALARHFLVTTRYEWMFWDAAYRQLDWPV